MAQTAGLQYTSAAVSGFLTGLMVVLTPLIAAALFGERVSRRGWLAVALAGRLALALVSLRGWRSPGVCAQRLLGAAGFSLQIASLSHWATRENSYSLTTVSVTVAALACGVTAGLTGEPSVPSGTEEWEHCCTSSSALPAWGYSCRRGASPGSRPPHPPR